MGRPAVGRKLWTIRYNADLGKHEVVSTRKEDRAPQLSLEEKYQFTKHNSYSYVIVGDYVPSYFGFNTARDNCTVGISLNIKDCRFNLLSMYDIGTVTRWVKDSLIWPTAQFALWRQKKRGIFHDSRQSLAKKGKEDPSKHNEVLTYAHWNLDGSSHITIFTDNSESRLLAQLRALHLKILLEDKYPDKKPIHVPISFYPDFRAYDAVAQLADKDAAKIADLASKDHCLYRAIDLLEKYARNENLMIFRTEDDFQEIIKLLYYKIGKTAADIAVRYYDQKMQAGELEASTAIASKILSFAEINSHFAINALVIELAKINDDGVLKSLTKQLSTMKTPLLGRVILLSDIITQSDPYAAERLLMLMQNKDAHFYHNVLKTLSNPEKILSDFKEALIATILREGGQRNFMINFKDPWSLAVAAMNLGFFIGVTAQIVLFWSDSKFTLYAKIPPMLSGAYLARHSIFPMLISLISKEYAFQQFASMPARLKVQTYSDIANRLLQLFEQDHIVLDSQAAKKFQKTFSRYVITEEKLHALQKKLNAYFSAEEKQNDNEKSALLLQHAINIDHVVVNPYMARYHQLASDFEAVKNDADLVNFFVRNAAQLQSIYQSQLIYLPVHGLTKHFISRFIYNPLYFLGLTSYLTLKSIMQLQNEIETLQGLREASDHLRLKKLQSIQELQAKFLLEKMVSGIHTAFTPMHSHWIKKNVADLMNVVFGITAVVSAASYLAVTRLLFKTTEQLLFFNPDFNITIKRNGTYYHFENNSYSAIDGKQVCYAQNITEDMLKNWVQVGKEGGATIGTTWLCFQNKHDTPAPVPFTTDSDNWFNDVCINNIDSLCINTPFISSGLCGDPWLLCENISSVMLNYVQRALSNATFCAANAVFTLLSNSTTFNNISADFPPESTQYNAMNMTIGCSSQYTEESKITYPHLWIAIIAASAACIALLCRVYSVYCVHQNHTESSSNDYNALRLFRAFVHYKNENVEQNNLRQLH